MSSISLEGPLESVDDRLLLRIPLEVGGGVLAPLAGGVGHIEGDVLVIEIQSWLAAKLGLQAGSLVIVDNVGGKLNITRSIANDRPGAQGRA